MFVPQDSLVLPNSVDGRRMFLAALKYMVMEPNSDNLTVVETKALFVNLLLFMSKNTHHLVGGKMPDLLRAVKNKTMQMDDRRSYPNLGDYYRKIFNEEMP